MSVNVLLVVSDYKSGVMMMLRGWVWVCVNVILSTCGYTCLDTCVNLSRNDLTHSLKITLTPVDQKSVSQKFFLKVSSEKRTFSQCVCKCQLVGCFVSNSVTGCNDIFKRDQSVHITFGTSVYMWYIGVKRGSGNDHKPQSLRFLFP